MNRILSRRTSSPSPGRKSKRSTSGKKKDPNEPGTSRKTSDAEPPKPEVFLLIPRHLQPVGIDDRGRFPQHVARYDTDLHIAEDARGIRVNFQGGWSDGSVVYLKGSILLIGGYYAGRLSDNIFQLDLSKEQRRWNLYHVTLYMRRAWHAAAIRGGDTIFVTGGSTEAGVHDGTTVLQECEYFKFSDEVETARERGIFIPTTTTAQMTTCRKHHCMVCHKGKLYVLGGQDENGHYLNSIEEYSPRLGLRPRCWVSSRGRSLIAPLAKFDVAIWKNRFYIIGGLTTVGIPNRRIDVVDISTENNNSTFPHFNGTRMGFPLAGFIVDDYFCVLGNKPAGEGGEQRFFKKCNLHDCDNPVRDRPEDYWTTNVSFDAADLTERNVVAVPGNAIQ